MGLKGSKQVKRGQKGVWGSLKVSIWLVEEEEEKRKFEMEENGEKGEEEQKKD